MLPLSELRSIHGLQLASRITSESRVAQTRPLSHRGRGWAGARAIWKVGDDMLPDPLSLDGRAALFRTTGEFHCALRAGARSSVLYGVVVDVGRYVEGGDGCIESVGPLLGAHT